MNRLYHKIHYIYWNKESKLIHLTNDEFADKLKKLEESGYNKVPLTTCVDTYFEENKNYSIKKVNNYFVLYLREKSHYVRYTTNWFDSSKMGGEGRESAQIVKAKFEELTGTTYKKAFNTVSAEYKRCIPRAFYYTNPRYLNKELTFSCIDASSHYPASICGRLPDSHTAIVRNGTVKPDREYPFAFYIKSGHVAEYGVFDTHNWLGDKYFALCLFRRGDKDTSLVNIDPDDDTTVLMKASEYELTDVYRYFYNIKQSCANDSKEYRDAKIVLNSSIGYFHKETYTTYKYAHLAAICIGRANQKMLNMANRIGPQYIAHIAVDGIIYLGNIKVGVPYKAIGKFYQEFTGLRGKIKQNNCYIMKDGDKFIYKHGAFNYYTDGRPITDENVKSIDDQYDWVRVDSLKELKHEETLQKENKG